MEFLRKNKKIIIPIAVAVGVIAIGVGALSAQVNSDKIAKNVAVSEVDLSELSKEEAAKKLETQKKFENINLKFGNSKWTIPKSEINLNIDFEKTAENAYNITRNDGYISNLGKTLKSDLGSKNTVNLVMNYDKDKLESKLEKIKKELDSPMKNAKLEFVDDKTKTIPEEPGRDMVVKSSLHEIDYNLKRDHFDIDLIVKLKEADIKTSDLKGIDTLLAEYSTSFEGMPSRDFNIRKSALDTSGILLKPGEEFSFNEIAGEKSISNGYKNAPVIESGKLVPGPGGGVCQTSSTIFNTALLSGMEITTRKNHSIPSNYVDLGRDATIVDGDPGQDFKFKNPYKHPVYVQNLAFDNKIVSQIYGASEDKPNIDIATEMTGSFGGGNRTVADASLPAGSKVVEKYGRPGYNVTTYRIFKDDKGNKIKTEKVAISSYPSQTGVIRVGAAAPKKAPAVKPTATQKSIPSQAPPVAAAPQGAPTAATN
ncbi:MAG: VanW family protein [Peptostreptococcus sp.]|uniref:VanW family protein n=1 Tax=Peptostreptococcus sp. TaxID=1262 RepID=UPI002FC75F96